MLNYSKFRDFTSILSESTGKNLHLEHLEDEILNDGIDGGRAAINFLQSLRDMLAGSANSKVNVTTKWDGAPAIFCGIDPSDNRFFVGTKGVFSKTPKLVKSEADVELLGFSGGLSEKLVVAIQELPKLGIDGVLQGDMMFTRSDIVNETIDGVNYITFQPNTIVYAVPEGSDLASKITTANMGIVFHTTYTGDTLESMNASFGADVSSLNDVHSIWYADAEYEDKSGSVTMTKSETATITNLLKKAGSEFHKINSNVLRDFLDMEKTYPSSASGSIFKVYNNSRVRAGKKITNARNHVKNYLSWFENAWETKVVGKVKSPEKKKEKKDLLKKYSRTIMDSSSSLIALTQFQTYLTDAKNFIVDKLDDGAKNYTKTFVVTINGYKVVNPEGYVAIDQIKGNAVKLVDRLEFSFNNFNAIKPWDKT